MLHYKVIISSVVKYKHAKENNAKRCKCMEKAVINLTFALPFCYPFVTSKFGAINMSILPQTGMGTLVKYVLKTLSFVTKGSYQSGLFPDYICWDLPGHLGPMKTA